MKRAIVAALLSLLGPGAGQIYNREYKKGVFILVLSTLLFIIPTVWLAGKITPLLPDPKKETITQEMVQSAVMQSLGHDRRLLQLVSILFLAFLGLWAYAITQSIFKALEMSEKKSGEESENGGKSEKGNE